MKVVKVAGRATPSQYIVQFFDAEGGEHALHIDWHETASTEDREEVAQFMDWLCRQMDRIVTDEDDEEERDPASLN